MIYKAPTSIKNQGAFLWRLIPTAWLTAIAHAHLAPWATGSNLALRVNRAIDDRPGIQQEAIRYQWFKQRLILSLSKPALANGHRLQMTRRSP